MITRPIGYGWGTKRSAISFEKSLISAAPLPTRVPFTEQLDDFFLDFAVTATWTPSTGGSQQTAYVILDSPDEEVLGGTVMSTEYAVTLIALNFPGLKGGETITVDGINYKVREPRLLEDGALKQFTLSKT